MLEALYRKDLQVRPENTDKCQFMISFLNWLFFHNILQTNLRAWNRYDAFLSLNTDIKILRKFSHARLVSPPLQRLPISGPDPVPTPITRIVCRLMILISLLFWDFSRGFNSEFGIFYLGHVPVGNRVQKHFIHFPFFFGGGKVSNALIKLSYLRSET